MVSCGTAHEQAAVVSRTNDHTARPSWQDDLHAYILLIGATDSLGIVHLIIQ